MAKIYILIFILILFTQLGCDPPVNEIVTISNNSSKKLKIIIDNRNIIDSLTIRHGERGYLNPKGKKDFVVLYFPESYDYKYYNTIVTFYEMENNNSEEDTTFQRHIALKQYLLSYKELDSLNRHLEYP